MDRWSSATPTLQSNIRKLCGSGIRVPYSNDRGPLESPREFLWVSQFFLEEKIMLRAVRLDIFLESAIFSYFTIEVLRNLVQYFSIEILVLL